MAEVARLTKEGEFKIKGEVDERLPAVTAGLVAHFPFDGRGGAFDAVGGHSPDGGVLKGVNLADALDWRNPDAWGNIDSQASATGMHWDEHEQAMVFTGNIYRTLKTPIVIDPNKTYYVEMEVFIENKGDTPDQYLLYLGGHRESSSYQKSTSNYDYSIIAGWNPSIGQ